MTFHLKKKTFAGLSSNELSGISITHNTDDYDTRFEHTKILLIGMELGIQVHETNHVCQKCLQHIIDL